MAVFLRNKFGITEERMHLIDLKRFQPSMGNEADRAVFGEPQYNAPYRLIALVSCMFDRATHFSIGFSTGSVALALSYHPHNRVVSYGLQVEQQLLPSESMNNIEFCCGNPYDDDRMVSARLVVVNLEPEDDHGRELYHHLKRIGFKGLLCVIRGSEDAVLQGFWEEIEIPKENLSDLGKSLGIGLIDFGGTGGPPKGLTERVDIDPIYAADQILRSFVIPVLDLSPHSRFNIFTLLEDLETIGGEVVCVFNSRDVYEKLKHHPRIDKFCFNKLNAGVGRSWNIGIDLAEGNAVYVMNADLHVGRRAIDELEAALFTLPDAVLIGPHGSLVDFEKLEVIQYYHKGIFHEPVQTHDVSGFFFCLHLERYLSKGLRFDPRYSPCFMEEWDMGLQVLRAKLACYAVPVSDFEHEWGVSANNTNQEIVYFGRPMRRNAILEANHKRFREKWLLARP